MAEKRMFSNQIINSDEFVDMPSDAQMLYVRLNLAADDRGICDKPRQIMNVCRAPDDCMKILIAKKFVLIPNCRPNVVVIKHWWINNNYRSQRFKETRYHDVLDELYYDENKSYSKNPDNHIPCLQCGAPISLPAVDQWIADGRPTVNQRLTDGRPTDTQRLTDGRPTDTQRLTQYSIDKNSIDKYSLDQYRIEEGGLRGEQAAPQKDEENSVNELPDIDPKEKLKRIDFFIDRIQFFEQMGYPSCECWLDMAEREGISRAEIDLRRMRIEKQKEEQK